MLFVFLVDTGSVLTFDMNVALETVANLKEVLFKATKVQPEKQVLLISGGQSLEPSHRVCSYSAGTDTNPIFLFCKSSIENALPPSQSMNFGSAQDLKEKVEACLSDKETTYQVVAARAHLAQQLHETAKDITRVCEQLVHDQHMQQQGWSAVVANLEDTVAAFKGRTDLFEQTYQQYLTSREENLEILGHFWDDLTVLADIPVLPCLVNGQDKSISLLDWIHSNDDENTNLNVVADHCTKALEQMDHQLLLALEKNIEAALSETDRPDLKEIGGLGERLFGLEQLLVEARKKVQEQGEMAQALLQNQQRARNLNDISILPDLCASHRQHLKVMIRNDEKLRDIRARCSRAKEELSNNLHARLRWVMFVQRKLADVDSRLVLQNENLRRLRRHFDLLRQLHQAPGVYFRSMIEVVRRRLFANKFMQWAGTLSSHSSEVHRGEIALRKTFCQSCEGHFLTLLFPGVVDNFSPSFATSPPTPFDTNLPAITTEDLEKLKESLPSLWARLKLPNNLKETLREPTILEWLHASAFRMNAQTELQMDSGVLPSLTAALLSPPVRPTRNKVKRSQSDFYASDYIMDESTLSIDNCRDDNGTELQRKMEDKIKNQRCHLLALQSHLQCAFEASQSALPAFRSELNSLRKLVVEWRSTLISSQFEEFRAKLIEQAQLLFTSTEAEWLDRLQAEKSEVKREQLEKEKLAEALRSSQREVEEWKERSLRWEREKIELQNAAHLRLKEKEKELMMLSDDKLNKQSVEHQLEMETLRDEMKVMQLRYQADLSDWQSAAEQVTPDALRTWRQELMLDHEMELEQLKLDKESELSGLLHLHSQMNEPSETEWRDKYQTLLKETDAQKKELREELERKNRMEIEGLRSRFRIMASASLRDRSPSDCSLDKFDMRSTPPASPRNPLRTRAFSESHSDDLLTPMVDKLKREKEKVLKLIEGFRLHCRTSNVVPTHWEEKLSEALRQSSQMMQNVGTKVDQMRLDNATMTGGTTSCLHHLPPLAQPPSPLSASISQVGSVNMAASVAVLQSTDDKSNSSLPPKSSFKKKPMSKLTRSLVRQGSANVYGCEVGDAVVVQWDERYSTHILYNKGPYLHFLHADSISSLGLRNAIEPFLARVVQREFCLVRKEENRYNLPKGTNFYRVKVERIAPSS